MKINNFVFVSAIVWMAFSCSLTNSNRILYLDEGISVQIDSLNATNIQETMDHGDMVSIIIYPNHGEKKIIETDLDKSQNEINNDEYQVDANGEVTIPLIGKINVSGKTEDEVELLLKNALSQIIKDPFIQVKVVNKRVILFSGKGQGMVIPLKNNNTTLLEIIAFGGGLKEYSKSDEIHLIRKINGRRKIFRFNLSSLQDLKAADVYVSNRDIVVVNYYPKKLQNSLKEINPWLNIITAGIALFSIIIRLVP